MNRVLARGLLVSALLFGSGIAFVLYVKSQPAALSRHNVIVEHLASLTTLNAQISQQALAVRQGLSPNYDPLTSATRRFGQQLASLERELDVIDERRTALRAELAALRAAEADRERAVERFKSGNSVLRNSLYYLPLAGSQLVSDVQRALAASPPGTEGATFVDVERTVGEVVELTLTQSLTGGRVESERLSDRLALARDLEDRLEEPLRERYGLFLTHAATVARMQPEVDGVLRRDVLKASAVGSLIEVERRYTALFEDALSEASSYRAALYAWSTLLLIVVLVAGLKLRSLYANLERLVDERTTQLRKAVAELWGEMQLAKKIQTALVPRELELRNCEVAGVMRPAEQVGGDYYDVFEQDGVEWVLIGDVSGHGVPAGLIMMMCQTAVRSVLTSRPNIGPDELLTTVNRTLTENIERLGEDKYMTISALRRDADGSFQVAGMHQDLLVYRAALGRVEHLPAQGTWLGIARDIRELNPVRRVVLAPGDTLVLYTDGITEAQRHGQVLDIEGLKRTMTAHGQDGAKALLQRILDTLDGYDVNDDVAAIVIRQLEPVQLPSPPREGFFDSVGHEASQRAGKPMGALGV